MLHAARRRGIDERAFLYGSVLMANSASLLLPGSNLTNLLVLGGQPVGGLTFASRMFPAWVVAVLITTCVLVGWRWGDLRAQPAARHPSVHAPQSRAGVGLVATAAAAALVLVLADPALPVLALGALTAAVQIVRGRLSRKAAARALNVPLLGGVFLLAAGLGAFARVWGAPGRFVHKLGSWKTAGLGAVASVLINNLPAAMLLTPSAPAHPRALLLGLNIGPNLAITGSLSAILWLQVARETGAEPSVVTYTRLGLLVVPCSLAAGIAALSLFTPAGLPL